MNRPKDPKELRLVSKFIFPEIFRSAHLIKHQINEGTQAKHFARSLAAEIKHHKTDAKIACDDSSRVIVDESIWVQIVVEEVDLAVAREELKASLIEKGEVLVGFVLQIGSEFQWKRVEIHDRHLKYVQVEAV